MGGCETETGTPVQSSMTWASTVQAHGVHVCLLEFLHLIHLCLKLKCLQDRIRGGQSRAGWTEAVTSAFPQRILEGTSDFSLVFTENDYICIFGTFVPHIHYFAFFTEKAEMQMRNKWYLYTYIL